MPGVCPALGKLVLLGPEVPGCVQGPGSSPCVQPGEMPGAAVIRVCLWHSSVRVWPLVVGCVLDTALQVFARCALGCGQGNS